MTDDAHGAAFFALALLLGLIAALRAHGLRDLVVNGTWAGGVWIVAYAVSWWLR